MKTVTVQCLDANECTWRFLTEAQRADMRALIRSHGYDPSDIRSVAYDVLDGPLLRFTIYETNDEGRKYLNCTSQCAGFDHADDCEIAQHVEETVLRGDLPSWWRPEGKPQ